MMVSIGSSSCPSDKGQAAINMRLAIKQSRKRKEQSLEELVSIQEKQIALDEATLKRFEAYSTRQNTHCQTEMLHKALMYAPERKLSGAIDCKSQICGGMQQQW